MNHALSVVFSPYDARPFQAKVDDAPNSRLHGTAPAGQPSLPKRRGAHPLAIAAPILQLRTLLLLLGRQQLRHVLLDALDPAMPQAVLLRFTQVAIRFSDQPCRDFANSLRRSTTWK